MNNDNDLQSIAAIIKEEIDKTEIPKKLEPQKPNIPYEISSTIVNRILNEPAASSFYIDASNVLVNLVKRFEMDNNFADLTFSYTEMQLKDKFKNFGESDPLYRKILHTIESMNRAAVMYFREYAVKEFENVHIADTLSRIKNTLRHTGEHGSKHLKEALLRTQKDVEERIEIQKEAVLNKSQIDDFEVGLSDKDVKNPEFTTTRQVLALRYLLEFVKAKDEKRNAQKRFTHFITGKDKSSIYKKFEDEGLGYNKAGEYLSFIRKQFEDLGLTEIVKMIDNDSV